jgi:hypothetical protein
MTLSPDIRHTIVSHTAGMNPKERAYRANALIRQYGIVEQADRAEVARLAAVRMEDVK